MLKLKLSKRQPSTGWSQIWSNRQFIIGLPYGTFHSEYKPEGEGFIASGFVHKIDIDGNAMPLWIVWVGTDSDGSIILNTVPKFTDMPPSSQFLVLEPGIWAMTFDEEDVEPPVEEPPVEPPIEEPPTEEIPPLDPSKINCLILCTDASKLPIVAQSYVVLIDRSRLDEVLEAVRQATLKAVATQVICDQLKKEKESGRLDGK